MSAKSVSKDYNEKFSTQKAAQQILLSNYIEAGGTKLNACMLTLNTQEQISFVNLNQTIFDTSFMTTLISMSSSP